MRRTELFYIGLVFVALLLSPCVAVATTEPDMPKGLWEAFSDARHAIEPSRNGDTGAFTAQSPKNHLVFRFGEHGLTVRSSVKGTDWSLTMALAAFGQEGAMAPLGEAAVAAEGRRIEYRRPGVTE